MFKSKISKKELIDLLLETRYEFEQLIISAFQKDLNYSGKSKYLQFEARFFRYG